MTRALPYMAARFVRRYFAGGVPVICLKVRMKCEWSKNPVSAAMSVMRLSVVLSRVLAALIRTFVI